VGLAERDDALKVLSVVIGSERGHEFHSRRRNVREQRLTGDAPQLGLRGVTDGGEPTVHAA
jgi:hypothetical protein